MNLKTINSFKAMCLVPLTAVCLASAPAQAQTAPAMSPSDGKPMGQMHKGAAGSHDMKAAMMMGMDGMQKMSMSGDTDRDFAMMMKMHHQGSIDLGMAEIKYGKHAEAKQLAEMAIKGDKESQERLQSFLNQHPTPEKIDADVYNQFMQQMKTAMEQMIQAYKQVPNTPDVDVDFVRRLIEHHKGAIAMATLQFKYGNDVAPTDEAGIIITEQAGAIKELATFANKQGIPTTTK